MHPAISIIGIIIFVILLVFAVVRARRANPEQSSSEMHPDTFKKPGREQVDKNKGQEPPATVL